MRALLDRLHVISHGITEKIAALGVIGILGIGFVTVLDVLLRFFFNNPIDGLNEITAPLLALGVAACLPAGASGRVNITIDFMQTLVGTLGFAWLRALGSGLLLIFLTVVVWRLFALAERYTMVGRTSNLLELPVGLILYVVTSVVALTLFVQLLQFALQFSDAFRLSRRVGYTICGLCLLLILGFFVVPAPYQAVAAVFTGMQPAFLALTCFGLMWLMVIFSVPVGAATGLAGLLGSMVILGSNAGMTMFGGRVHHMLFNESLAVLPLFLMMGSFATVAGMSSEIYRFANSAIGHLRGGLAMATILGSAGFGALTGSSLATSATIGKVALPEMAKRNYSRSLAAGTVAAGGTLGQLIPPSTVIVIYALLAEASIGTLFIATIVPALLAVCLYLVAISITVKLSPGGVPKGERVPRMQMMRDFGNGWQVIVLITLVIGGIYTGVFTETEAASVGAIAAFGFAIARGKINRDTIWAVMRETTSTIALIYVLIFGATNFSFMVGISGVPDLMVAGMTALTTTPVLIVIMIAAIYLVLGTVMDTFAIMIITLPVFLPLVESLGFDPIWWGILTICLVEIGMITPPFGLNLFIMKSIDPHLKLTDVYKGVAPFVVADVVKIALLIGFPIIVLWLPGTR
ncbi:TRAP transporter large permease subunit [Pararhodobacter oceanensis]|uniref:Uncharacterized protein n=1 Tax=Pararhodobacter oceanensis TaxID=2172121 RepID=A0A2T8HTC8_9RHOB|nr:TRAP transporter large permease subunit [Pararhodobacter oceanensis]PVH28695.1 hypothetical protein DDE20_10930 [Pararhodobacter oceanensis]